MEVLSAERLLVKLPYAENERDMIALQHEFVIEYPDRTEQAYSTMVDFGIPGGDSSMARTVSLPVSIGDVRVFDDVPAEHVQAALAEVLA